MEVAPIFQWILGMLLATIAYFLMRLVNKIDEVDKNVTLLMVSDGIKKKQLENIEERLHHVEKTLKVIVQ